MFSLTEYREPTQRLPDLLPWAGLIAPGVVVQKDGLLQKTIAFRGPDLGSSSERELVYISAQINNALMRLGSGWSMFVEAQRFRTAEYPCTSSWRHPAARIADLERARLFEDGVHFDSSYYLTLVWQLPSEVSGRVESFFYEEEGRGTNENAALRRDVEKFQKSVRELVSLLDNALPDAIELDDDETLTYLHSTVSTNRHVVRTPDVPMYLDAQLADMALTPGDNPMLGGSFLLTATVNGVPGITCPGILDALNYLETEYRWVTRYIALDRSEATKLIEKYRRKWTQRRKGLFTLLKEEAAGGEESRLINNSADDKSADAGEALRQVGDGALGFGYLTTTVSVWDEDLEAARRKMALVKRALQDRGFAVQDETINSREAWLGSLPGHVWANVRRPIVSTQNLAHVIPASSVWTGEPHNEHLRKVSGVSTPHVTCTTTGSTPFRLNLNVDDVGHTLVIGPTGAGKSTLLATLALQWMKYPGSQVVIFDKDRSALAATLGVGGIHLEPGNSESPVAFQPLAEVDGPARPWATDFTLSLFAAQNVAETPQLREHIDAALDMLSSRPPEQRTIGTLSHVLESLDFSCAQALQPYCRGGPFSQIFDGERDEVATSDWTLIEMGHLMSKGPSVVVPALLHLFRRVEHSFTGAPTLLVLDEAWLFLTHPVFAERLQSWLKTLRKKNVFVVFATQEVADASRNPVLKSTILSACATKIFLADPEASTPAMASSYSDLGLTPTEIDNLSAMRKKRDYYLRSVGGRRVFTLSLGPAQLTFVGMSSEQDQKFLNRLMASAPPSEWAEKMLEHRGVTWAATELRAERARGSAQEGRGK